MIATPINLNRLWSETEFLFGISPVRLKPAYCSSASCHFFGRTLRVPVAMAWDSENLARAIFAHEAAHWKLGHPLKYILARIFAFVIVYAFFIASGFSFVGLIAIIPVFIIELVYVRFCEKSADSIASIYVSMETMQALFDSRKGRRVWAPITI